MIKILTASFIISFAVTSAYTADRAGTASFGRAPAMQTKGGRAPAVNAKNDKQVVSQNNQQAKETLDEDALAAEEYMNEIMGRYSAALSSAAATCPEISDKLDQMKQMMGITTGAGAIGTLAGGAATATGFMKESQEKKLVESNNEFLEKYKQDADSNAAKRTMANALQNIKDNDPSKLGTIRTIGSFTAGGANAMGAATGFISLSQFDELVDDIDGCNAAISELDRVRNELSIATAEEGDEVDTEAAETEDEKPEIAAIARIDEILNECKGLNSKNIASIKSKMMASGTVTAIAAATGVAGGVTSMMSNKNANMDGVSNILVVTTTAGSLGGAVLGGMTMADLSKNSAIAESCQSVLSD